VTRPDPTIADVGWTKYAGNPVLGGPLGTCFDISVDVSNGRYRMWFSWRPRNGIGYAESADGLDWKAHEEVVLGPLPGDSSIEDLQVTRPFVLVEHELLTMWYSAHSIDRVVIARATSRDGVHWDRHGAVLTPEEPWEKAALMCPSVIRDDDGLYHMWYSGGERYEPDAIGYATSRDGVTWTRVGDRPVLRPDRGSWDRDRVAGAHVFRHGAWLYAAYIGFANGFEDSSIGIARSNDGIHWERHAGNPVITRGEPGEFDSINVYKPFVVVDGDEWRMWFNGSSPTDGPDENPPNRIEQIGYASCRFEFQQRDLADIETNDQALAMDEASHV